jgi:hypothetical protein
MGVTNRHNVKLRVKGPQFKFNLGINLELLAQLVKIPYPKPLFRHL